MVVGVGGMGTNTVRAVKRRFRNVWGGDQLPGMIQLMALDTEPLVNRLDQEPLFADEFAGAGVRMNNVLPGWIDSLPATEERRGAVPMRRYGTAEEIAATVAFLLSEGSGYITGQNLRVDGGLMRSV